MEPSYVLKYLHWKTLICHIGVSYSTTCILKYISKQEVMTTN